MTSIADQIKFNWTSVQERVAAAAEAADRTAADVRIVGVTKYVTPDIAALLFQAGCNELGESRPQQLLEKADALAELDVTWHMIGHLQRNKVARTLPQVALVHSVDSLRLANAIDRISGEQSGIAEVLLEVNVSGEEAKFGFTSDSLKQQLSEIVALPNVRVRGLMCMAGLGEGEQETRAQFASLRELRDELKPTVPQPHSMDELSMGMSGDFEMAIAEGATIVRIGSVLFDGVR